VANLLFRKLRGVREAMPNPSGPSGSTRVPSQGGRGLTQRLPFSPIRAGEGSAGLERRVWGSTAERDVPGSGVQAVATSTRKTTKADRVRRLAAGRLLSWVHTTI
jgi:hypothetical protein